MQQPTVSDLADDSPYTYAQINEARRLGILGGLLMDATPKQRVGMAAVCSERTGKPVSRYQVIFNSLIVEEHRRRELTRVAFLATLPL